MNNITAAVIAGGKGTRLSPAVSDRPKALAETAGRAFICRLLDQLCRADISKAVICTGFKAQMIEDYLGNRYRSLDLIYSRESEPLGTGGALRNAADFFDTPAVLALNGDSFVDLPLKDFAESHFQNRTPMTMAAVYVNDLSRYGAVEIEEGKIVRFCEKNSSAGSGFINAGAYVFDRDLVLDIPAGGFVSLEKDFFPKLAEQKKISAFKTNGRFIDIGTPESFALAQEFFANSNSINPETILSREDK